MHCPLQFHFQSLLFGIERFLLHSLHSFFKTCLGTLCLYFRSFFPLVCSSSALCSNFLYFHRFALLFLLNVPIKLYFNDHPSLFTSLYVSDCLYRSICPNHVFPTLQILLSHNFCLLLLGNLFCLIPQYRSQFINRSIQAVCYHTVSQHSANNFKRLHCFFINCLLVLLSVPCFSLQFSPSASICLHFFLLTFILFNNLLQVL